MKARVSWAFLALVLCMSVYSHAQNPEITQPFESLTITDVKATGNAKTGTVEIRMDFHNGYEKPATVSLDFGGFDRFGITDGKGEKYKLYTNSSLIGTSDVNKGYQPVSYIRFGDKTQDWITTVQQEIPPGETKTLTVRLDKVNTDIKFLKEIHGSCILALISHVGDKPYRVENLPIKWSASGR